MEEWFLGEIRLFAIGYAPAGWAQCNGQMLNVSELPSFILDYWQ